MSNIEVGEINSDLAQFAYAIFLFSIVSFFCFINIIIYGLVYYLAQNTKYNDEKSYPFFSWMIKIYSKFTLFSLSIEIILCFITLLCTLAFSIFALYSVSTITWNG